MQGATIKNRLISKGVRIIAPESVYIDPEIDPDRIFSTAVIYPGCRIMGRKTCLCPGAVLGEEGPVTIENCYIGPNVKLKGGYFKSAVFLDGAKVGSGAHVREGTILEEMASAAHCVGLKQTILFPFVTLGSLINFCDCFMAGGSGPDDHSEVGSGYVHFNFTPQQDKATPSLIGDVPHGITLRKRRIFLGGQGGLVGPCRISYGTVIAAGSICRRDEFRENRMILEAGSKRINIAYDSDRYRGDTKRIISNNIAYIANLVALMAWYRWIRADLAADSAHGSMMVRGLIETLAIGISERIYRFDKFLSRLSGQMDPHAKKADGWIENKDKITSFLQGWEDFLFKYKSSNGQGFDRLKEIIEKERNAGSSDYIRAVKAIPDREAAFATSLLENIVRDFAMQAAIYLPFLNDDPLLS